MFEIVHELDPRDDLRVTEHRRLQLAREEVDDAEVLVRARRRDVLARRVQLDLDQRAVVTHRPFVALFLLPIPNVVNSEVNTKKEVKLSQQILPCFSFGVPEETTAVNLLNF